MEGWNLYELYAEGMEARGTNVDSWEQLDEDDQAAWTQAASQVEPTS